MFKQKKKMLSIDQMIQGEKWIAKTIQSGVNLSGDMYAVCDQLRLHIIEKTLRGGIEGILKAPEVKGYNGTIIIDPSSSQSKFPMTHEVVHYLKDVGINKVVTGKYERVAKGRKKDAHEQYIDYITAAILMPWKSIAADIDSFEFGMDEIAFLKKCAVKYGQDITDVFNSSLWRRFLEVKAIRNHPELANT